MSDINNIINFLKLSKEEKKYIKEIKTIQNSFDEPLERKEVTLFYQYYKLSFFIYIFVFSISVLDCLFLNTGILFEELKIINFAYTIFVAYGTFGFLFISHLYKYLYGISDLGNYISRKMLFLHLFILMATTSICIFSLLAGYIHEIEPEIACLFMSPVLIYFLWLTSFNRVEYLDQHLRLYMLKKNKEQDKKFEKIKIIIAKKNNILKYFISSENKVDFIEKFYNEANLNQSDKIAIKKLFLEVRKYNERKHKKLRLFGSNLIEE